MLAVFNDFVSLISKRNEQNYVNDRFNKPYLGHHFIIEEIEEKIEEKFEEEEQTHIINQYDFQSDNRNKISIKQI